MANLAESALRCAIQLGRANAAGTDIISLGPEIRREIGEAIRYYNRQPWALTEFYDCALTTSEGVPQYASFDMSDGAGEQGATVFRNSEVVTNILDIVDFRDVDGEEICPVDYREYKRLAEDSPNDRSQLKYARFAGRLWLWPTPNGAYRLTFSAYVKPVVPTGDSSTSVWLDQASEMIEAAACKRVCIKYLRDTERAAVFGAIEREAEMAFQAEHVRKTTTRRIKPHE